jgi:hypothetical protein
MSNTSDVSSNLYSLPDAFAYVINFVIPGIIGGVSILFTPTNNVNINTIGSGTSFSSIDFSRIKCSIVINNPPSTITKQQLPGTLANTSSSTDPSNPLSVMIIPSIGFISVSGSGITQSYANTFSPFPANYISFYASSAIAQNIVITYG